MTPPQRLRKGLAASRAKGYTFGQAWPHALSAALRDLPLRETVWWRRTLTEQRPVWAANYSGPNVSRRLAPTASDDHRDTLRGPVLIA